jgi:hypothetical protein
VFSFDDGETSFVDAAAEAGGRPAEGGGRQRSRAVTDGGGHVGAWRRLGNGREAAAAKSSGTVASAC